MKLLIHLKYLLPSPVGRELEDGVVNNYMNNDLSNTIHCLNYVFILLAF